MSRLHSQIPRLKPASSYGNLSQLTTKNDKIKSHHGSQHSLHKFNATPQERTPMIMAPTPVTHRRMFPNYYLTKPPWAIDETISPFDREPEKIHSSRNFNRMTQSDHGKQSHNVLEPISIRVESPSFSMDYIPDSLQRDEFDRNLSPFEIDSYYKSEIHRFVPPEPSSRQVSACQTDITGMDLDYVQNQRNQSFQSVSPQIKKTEKRQVVPLKELKRTSDKNHLTYKISKSNTNQEPVDFNKVFNVQEQLTNHSDEDIQSRIDYWLNKSISLDPSRVEKSKQSNVKIDSTKSEEKKPMYRNQITFTPRQIHQPFSENGNSKNLVPLSSSQSNPQMIEAVIFQSDSESEKDYIVSSKSLENKLNRSTSHFTIRANLTSKTKLPKTEIRETATCEVCNQSLFQEDEMNYCEIRCHKKCFKCFWCKKKLSTDNYKININKLCCPLHFRLLSN